MCSAGLLRSPTVAWILSNEPFNFNTRAVGSTKSHALIPIDEVHIHWADLIVFVEPEVHEEVWRVFQKELANKFVLMLQLPDMYEFRDPRLVELATEQLHEGLKRIAE